MSFSVCLRSLRITRFSHLAEAPFHGCVVFHSPVDPTLSRHSGGGPHLLATLNDTAVNTVSEYLLGTLISMIFISLLFTLDLLRQADRFCERMSHPFVLPVFTCPVHKCSQAVSPKFNFPFDATKTVSAQPVADHSPFLAYLDEGCINCMNIGNLMPGSAASVSSFVNYFNPFGFPSWVCP